MNAVLKYPGAKNRIAPWIVGYFPKHHSYLEPYCGSCAVLINKPKSNIETINDLSGDVVNLFRCIQSDPERLAADIWITPFSRQVYSEAFETETDDPFMLARRFLIQCWQGHGFRTDGSVVGWKHDVQGREASYALRNWNRLPQWIVGIAERFKQVQIENQDALQLITRFNYSNVLIYCDPPYVIDSRISKRKQYEHEMTDEDHKTLLKSLKNHKGSVVLSGYPSELYDTELSGWYRVTRSGYSEYQGCTKERTEVLWMNFQPERGLLDAE